MPKPKFSTRKERIQAAMLMYHGIGREEGMKVPEIADKLNVTERTVRGYLDANPVSNAMRDRIEDVKEQQLRVLIDDLQDRLSRLKSIEEELMDSVEVVVTEYDQHELQGTLEKYKTENYTISTDEDVSHTVSLPSEVKQVPQFDRLQAVWEEQRKTQEQLVTVLGLKEPDQVEVQGDFTERKLWGLDSDDDPLPEQDVRPVDGHDGDDE